MLYEFVNRNGPFNLFSLSCGIGIIISIVIYWKRGRGGYNKGNNINDINTDLLS